MLLNSLIVGWTQCLLWHPEQESWFASVNFCPYRRDTVITAESLLASKSFFFRPSKYFFFFLFSNTIDFKVLSSSNKVSGRLPL